MKNATNSANAELIVKVLSEFNTHSYVRSWGIAQQYKQEHGAKLREIKDIFNSCRILGLLEIRGHRSGSTYRLTHIGEVTLKALKEQASK